MNQSAAVFAPPAPPRFDVDGLPIGKIRKDLFPCCMLLFPQGFFYMTLEGKIIANNMATHLEMKKKKKKSAARRKGDRHNGELLYGSKQDGQGQNDGIRGTVGLDMSRT